MEGKTNMARTMKETRAYLQCFRACVKTLEMPEARAMPYDEMLLAQKQALVLMTVEAVIEFGEEVLEDVNR
jgi:hypothetical protein